MVAYEIGSSIEILDIEEKKLRQLVIQKESGDNENLTKLKLKIALLIVEQLNTKH